MIELVNKKNSVKLENKKVIALDNTLTKEGYAADAKAVGDALSNIEVSGGTEQIQADFSQQDKAAVDYIKNKPCYKKVETSLTSEVIANPQLGITLLYDLNQLYKGYYQYYTLPYLTNTNSPYQMGINCRLYMTSDYYVDTFIQASSGKLLDTVNVKLDINTVQGFYAYYITDLKALSEENKAKFPSIGIYFEATNENNLANLKNIQSVVYSYTRLTKYYMPTDTVYTEDMTSYVDEAITNIELPENTTVNKEKLLDTTIEIPADTPVISVTLPLPDNAGDYDTFDIYIGLSKATNEGFTSTGGMNVKLFDYGLMYFGLPKISGNAQQIVLHTYFKRRIVEAQASSVSFSTNRYTPYRYFEWLPENVSKEKKEFKFDCGTSYSGTITMRIYGYK